MGGNILVLGRGRGGGPIHLPAAILENLFYFIVYFHISTQDYSQIGLNEMDLRRKWIQTKRIEDFLIFRQGFDGKLRKKNYWRRVSGGVLILREE